MSSLCSRFQPKYHLAFSCYISSVLSGLWQCLSFSLFFLTPESLGEYRIVSWRMPSSLSLPDDFLIWLSSQTGRKKSKGWVSCLAHQTRLCTAPRDIPGDADLYPLERRCLPAFSTEVASLTFPHSTLCSQRTVTKSGPLWGGRSTNLLLGGRNICRYKHSTSIRKFYKLIKKIYLFGGSFAL